MPVMRYADFIETLENRLAPFSREELIGLFIGLAEQTPASERQEFLDKLVLPEKAQDIPVTDVETLLAEIEDFAQRVGNGDYFDYWGWDDELDDERDWGDESWAKEMDVFLLQAGALFAQGKYGQAKDAYTLLFEVLDMGQEPGHLPGNPDLNVMLHADLDKQVGSFLRCVYLDATPPQRPELISRGLYAYGHWYSGKPSLQRMLDASDSKLPDFDNFLNDWIDFLKSRERVDSALLREAVRLQGVPAIAAFAKQYADQYPSAFIDWIEALEKEGAKPEAVLEAVREGLDAIPRDSIVRAEVAGVLARIGAMLGNQALVLEGYQERFHSRPSMEHVLDLYITAIECDRWEAVREQAERRVKELLAVEKTPAGRVNDSERMRSAVSKWLASNVLLIGGRVEQAFDLCRNEGFVGWSAVGHPKPTFVTFIMVELAKSMSGSSMIMKQWELAIAGSSYGTDKDYMEKYRKAADYARKRAPFTEEQEAFYLQWCLEEIGRRVDDIVGNKHRGSYNKAAGLLVALAEVFASRGDKQEGDRLIETYRSKYPKHNAFKSELAAALKDSSLC